ncbi:MAG: caspase family protein [Deltaproteobacteria bacterium]|nr:caspase family protein [Deltaproteobacteria bacterium]
MRAWIVIGIGAVLFAALPAGAATRKYAVLIGNNEGHDPSEALRFAEQDARKMGAVLSDLGGFAPVDVTVLEGGDADGALAALRATEKRLKDQARAGEKTMLLIYYSGHAEGDVLELGRSSLPFSKLSEALRSSAADVRVAFVDSCESGRLIALKGGRRGPAFDIRVTDEINSRGYAIVTSSAGDELSQESAEIRGAVFTHFLVSALRGAGDESGDGRVTLTEAYRYAYARTLARTSRTAAGGQHPMYDFALQGRGEVVLTSTERSGSLLSVTGDAPGRLLVLDAKAESIVAESEVTAGKPALVAVSPGTYVACLVSPDGTVREAVARVEAGGRTDLLARDFASVKLEESVSKGGLFRRETGALTHRIGVGGLWRLFALKGGVASYGATAHYRMELPSGFEPGARLTWTTREDVGLSTGYNDVGLQLGAGWVFGLKLLDLRAALLAGYEHMFEDDRDGKARGTPAFTYLGLVGVELPLGPLYATVEAGVGGRVFKVVGEGTVHRLDVQAVLSLGWRWIE